MSRRSTFRQSARYSSVPYTSSDSDDRIVRWERESVSPALPAVDSLTTPAISQSGTPAPGGLSDSYGNKNNAAFYVKIWVSTGEKLESSTAVDCDEDDILIFERPVRVVVEEPKQEGGLSAADIRGAVGGEAIPGMSASSQYPKENGSAKTEEGQVNKIEEVTDTPQVIAEESGTPVQIDTPIQANSAEEVSTVPAEDTEMTEAGDL